MTDSRRVRRWRVAMAGVAVLVLGLTSRPALANALDDILAAGVVRIAVPEDLPPFGAKDKDGKLEGYDVEVAKLLAKGLGVRVALVPVTSVDPSEPIAINPPVPRMPMVAVGVEI